MMKRAAILFGLIILTLSLMMLTSGCASDASKDQSAPAGQPASTGRTSEANQPASTGQTSQTGQSGQDVETAPAGQTVTADGNANAADTAAQAVTTAEPGKADNGLWTAAEMPVKLVYGCVNETFLEAETTDPVIIGQAIDAIKALEIGEANNMETLDAADDLRFIFEDGSEVRLKFEGDNWITEDHERYHVEGLSRLHSALYVLFQE